MKQSALTRFVVVLLQSSCWLVGSNPLVAQTDSPDPTNLVVAIHGRASFKRQGWTKYAAIVFGTGLQEGDLLDLGESSSAKVVCSDLTLHDVPMGIGAIPCPTSRVALQRQDGSLIRATRGWPNDGSSPILLSPRKTKLLSPYPTIRWTPVKGATTYHVSIRGLHFSWTSDSTIATTLVYSDKTPRLKPGLEPGGDYKVTVVADGRGISDEPGFGLGFSIIGTKEKDIVFQERRQIEHFNLPDGPTRFLIAHLYANHGLNAEAIDLLEEISQTFKVAAAKRLQGDLYMKVGLPRQAEAAYLASLDLSKSENDGGGQMLDRKALAYIYEQIVGNREAAYRQLEETLNLARDLGDDLTASQAARRLAELKALSPKFRVAETKTESGARTPLPH